jgi:Na+/proline symporter
MLNDDRVNKESNSLSGDERSRPALRRFHLRHAYGLATVNFIAIIQLISTPQISLDWQWLLAPHSISQLPRVLGFAGMLAMIASVPLLVAFAICFEVITQEEPDFPNHELNYLEDTLEMAFMAVVWLGILGLGATLCACLCGGIPRSFSPRGKGDRSCFPTIRSSSRSKGHRHGAIT